MMVSPCSGIVDEFRHYSYLLDVYMDRYLAYQKLTALRSLVMGTVVSSAAIRGCSWIRRRPWIFSAKWNPRESTVAYW